MPNKLFEEGLKLVSVFKEVSQNFIFHFLHNKAAKNLKTIGAYTESNDIILKTFKKIFISWHCPFKLKQQKWSQLVRKIAKIASPEGWVYKEAKPKPGLDSLFCKDFLIRSH